MSEGKHPKESKRYRVAIKDGKAFVITKTSMRLIAALEQEDWLGYADLDALVKCADKSVYTLMKRLYDNGLVLKEYDTDIYGLRRVYYKLADDIQFLPTMKLSARERDEEE